MGRSLGTDVHDAATRPGGSGAAGGSRVQFVLRRTRSAPLLPASLLLAILVSVTVTTGLAGFAGRALPAAAHARLAHSPATPIQVSGQFGPAQARRDDSVIRASIHSALGGVPFTLASGRWSDQLALPSPHGASQPPQIQAAVLSGVRAHITLTAGTWPGPPRAGAPLGVALPVTTAALLHYSVGQVLALRDSLTGAPVRLEVTGLYRPRDPAAPYWRLSLLGTSGKFVQGTFLTYGPVLAGQSILGPHGLGVSAASWLITVDTAAIPARQAGSLGRRLAAVVSSWRSRPGLGGLQVSTGLPQILAALASSLVVSRSLLLIGSLQLLLLATAGAVLAARLLASQREGETAMLSARGAARGQLLRASLAEAVLLAVIGAAAGIVAGGYLTDALMSANRLPAGHPAGGLAGIVTGVTAGAAWWPAVVIVAGVIVVMMWPSLRPVTPGTARARRGRPAALAATARAGLDAALIALGAASFWELRRYSAVPRLSGGTLGIDPVLAVAPVLALAGIALLPLRLLPAAARLLDRASTRGRRLAAALASWQVSRRAVREGSPVLLVILAVATGTLALAQHQSWRQSQLDQAALAAGADVRVTLPAPLPLGDGRIIAQAAGVRTAMPVADFNSGFTVLALGARQAAATVLLRPDLASLPTGQLWRLITPRTAGPGLGLPGHPARLGIEASLVPPRAAQPSLAAGLSAGQVTPVRAGRRGDRLHHPGRDAARRRTRPPADRRTQRYGPGPLPAAAAGPVGELPAARVPGAPLRQRGGPARGAAGRAPGGRPRHAGGTRPGGLPADLGRVPGPVRRGGRPGPMACRGLLRGPGQPAGPRGRACRHLLAGQRGRGRADVHGRGRASRPGPRGAAAAGDRPAGAHRRGAPAAHPGPRDPVVRQRRRCAPG